MRSALIERKTSETDIKLELRLPQKGVKGSFEGTSGVGFFDHMLNAVCVHGGFGMKLTMTGDLSCDDHHSIEDFGIVFGKAMARALESGGPVKRFGSACIPMDESLSRCVLDICGRPYLVFHAFFKNQYIGQMESCMLREFFYAFAVNSGITLHVENLYGENDHHKAESICKAFAYALSSACEEIDGPVISTKGSLGS